MSNKKQTAVEWFFKWFNDNPEATHKEYAEAFEQAKEIEKSQIVEAFESANECSIENECKLSGKVDYNYEDGEQYYSQTYNQ